MELYGKQPTTSNIPMNDQPVGDSQTFTFLGCKLTHLTKDNIDWKITRFHYMCGTIRRVMIWKKH